MDLTSPATAPGSATTRSAASTGNEATDEATGLEAVPERVLVATDGSATSASAERAGIELATRFGASLIFLSVIDPSGLRPPGGLFHTRVDQVRAQRESALARIVDKARQHGVAAQFLIWEGDPSASVIEAAAAEGADVIVIGSHDRGPIGRRLLGSVSAQVLARARQPVIVIRPGERLDDVWPIRAPGPNPTANAVIRPAARSV